MLRIGKDIVPLRKGKNGDGAKFWGRYTSPYKLAKEKEPNIHPLFLCLLPINLDSAMWQLYNQTISQWNDIHAKLYLI